VADDPISPELALVDPAFARRPAREGSPMIDPPEPPRPTEASDNAAIPAEGVPPLETLLYDAGLITADQLGELVRDSVVFRSPVGTVALERGLVTPETIQGLLAHAGATVTRAEVTNGTNEAPAAYPAPVLVERVEEAAYPPPAILDRVEQAAQAWGHVTPATPTPVPDAPEQTLPPVAASPDLAPAYTLMLRLQNGERIIVDAATTFESAFELARAIAARCAAAGEWPQVAGRFIRPEAIVSVDVERSLDA
jgi:hypothetical protein